MTGVPTAHFPDPVALAAHRALHTQWQWPGQDLPESGTGCGDCVPDIRDILAPLWPTLLSLAVTHPEMGPDLDTDPAYEPAVLRAAIDLHETWSPGSLEPGEHCIDCRDDIEAVLDGIWPLLSKEITR